MPNIYTPHVFLRAFSKVYKTLDVRVAAIRHEEQWLLVALSAHFRRVSTDSAKADFQNLVDRYGKVDSSAFRVIQQCFPISEAAKLFERLGNGELLFGDSQIRLSEPHDVLSHAGNVRVDYQNPERWPCIQLQRQITKDPETTLSLLN